MPSVSAKKMVGIKNFAKEKKTVKLMLLSLLLYLSLLSPRCGKHVERRHCLLRPQSNAQI